MLRTTMIATAVLGLLATGAVAGEPSVDYQVRTLDPVKEKMAAMQLAIIEAMRLANYCDSPIPGACDHSDCDAQGQRPSGNNCVLVWKREEGKPEYLTWVEDWEVHGSIYSPMFRLPTLGQDGKLY